MRGRRQKRNNTRSHVSGYIYIVHIQLRCTNESAEFSLTSSEQPEMILENAIGQVLYTLFDTVLIDKVSLKWVSQPTTFPSYHILINAHCPHQFPTSSIRLTKMEHSLEDMLTSVFSELFNTVFVEQVVVKFLPTKEWERILAMR